MARTESDPKLLGIVTSFGDPLLLVDRTAALGWPGVGAGDDFSPEYQRALEALDGDGVAFAVGGMRGALWDIQGEGAAYVFATGNGLLLVRPWMNDDVVADEAEAAVRLAAVRAKRRPRKIAVVRIASGQLVVMGSATSGEVASEAAATAPWVRLGEDEGILVALPCGDYEVTCDGVESDAGEARRCWLAPARSTRRPATEPATRSKKRSSP